MRQDLKTALKKKKARRVSNHWSPARIFLAAILVSFVAHLGSMGSLSFLNRDRLTTKGPISQPIKIKFVEKKPPQEPTPKKILEAKQKETEKPDNPRFAGQVNHKTEKETKTRFRPPKDKGLDPGDAGKSQQNKKRKKMQTKENIVAKAIKPSAKERMIIGRGKGMPISKPQPRNQYEQLLAHSYDDLKNQVKAGYQDYINDNLEIGESIDINTSEYRFIGYFTSLRKAIQLVWNYPSDAVHRGMEGVVGLRFSISEKGHATNVKVVKSSGYSILDDAIVNAIHLASPFSPLPKNLGKDKITVHGNFSYALTYGGG